MANIQGSGWPLVFSVRPDSFNVNPLAATDEGLRIRTSTRALEGMQKEALVEYGAAGHVWRMVCDEGPYLNGTDLAPFPLGFFAAGLTASFMSAYLAEARMREIAIEQLAAEINNHYTMEGSALAGTMSAGVLPTTVTFTAVGDASAAELEDVGEVAIADRSHAHVVLGEALPSAFAIRGNDRLLEHGLRPAPRMGDLVDPLTGFERIQPAGDLGQDLTIIEKARQVADTPPGTPSVGLQADQKRRLHVNAAGVLRPDGLKAITAHCVQPASSAFTFLSDDSELCGGQARAPSGLAYLSAGVAFCFMTQLGRYAQIARQNLDGYRIVQDTTFTLVPAYSATAGAVETLACIDAREPDENIQRLVQMGEQTCYLHGALRLPVKPELATA